MGQAAGFEGDRRFYHLSPLSTTWGAGTKGVAQINSIGLRCLKI